MESQRIYWVGLLALTMGFSSIAAAWEPTAQDDKEMLAYMATMPGRAVEFEKAGDRALGAGDSATAIKDYAHAIALIVLTPDYGINFPSGAVRLSQGWELHKVKPGPAYAAGLRNGDILTAINGTSIGTLSPASAYHLLDDNSLDPVTLTVIRGGAAPFDIKPGLPELIIAYDNLPLANWADVNRLLEKQVALYAKMATHPPIPQEARRLAAKGQELAKSATTSAQIKAASDQYKMASFAAPWWADLYVNYGLFQDASGDALGAKQSFELYALLNPQGRDLDAVKAKISGLSNRASNQTKLQDWEGWWSQLINGQKQTTGMRVVREGNLLSVTNLDKKQPWLRATITGDNTAQAIVRFSSDSSVLTPAFLNAVNKCFNGGMELTTNISLSPDRKQLTLISYNDLDVDFASCAIVRQEQSRMVWVK